MKLLNYSLDYLVETRTPQPPKRPYSDCQYWILCRIIRGKRIQKTYFYNLINQIYGCGSVKELSYEQMYRLIYILNHWKLADENKNLQ